MRNSPLPLMPADQADPGPVDPRPADPASAVVHFDAALQQGVRYLQANRAAEAIACLRGAVTAMPDHAVAHNCLGMALRMAGKLSEAIACYRTALTCDELLPEAHNNLANALCDVQEVDEAERHYVRALQLRPAFAQAHNNLGVLLSQRKRIDEATQCYRQALAAQPRYIEALNNLANALRQQGRAAEAVRLFQQALQLAPNADICNNLGNAYRDLGRLKDAAGSYQQALRLRSDFVAAWSNLGTVLADQGNVPDALSCYEKSAALAPDLPDNLLNLANLYRQMERLEDARRHYQRVLALRPTCENAWLRLNGLLPAIHADREALEQQAQRALAIWQQQSGRLEPLCLETLIQDVAEPPFNLQFHHADIRPWKEAYARMFHGRLPRRLPPNIGSGRLRVGVLVTRKHEGVFLNSMAGVLERLPQDELEIGVLCSQATAGRVRSGIRNPDVAIWPLPEQFDAAAQRIAEHRLDVLYFWEIGTDATNYFLPFLRLAPVQCTSWGIQVTSGIPEVDYYLSSRLVEPADAQQHYSERLVLADTLLTYRLPPRPPVRPRSRSSFQLADDAHLYLCAQHPGKLHPDFDPLLRDILRTDRQGLIVLTGDRHGDAASQLEARFAKTLPDVVERIRVIPRQAEADYLSLIGAADVLLDPPHFSGVNTTYDGLALGKPIVTCPSPFHRGRYTAGCYRKMQYEACVAKNDRQYVEIAVRLGTDRDYRRQVQQQICDRASMLFRDEQAVTEHLRIFRTLGQLARRV